MNNQELVLAAALATNTPVLLWGSPGIGKTATVYALAEAHGWPVKTVIASIHEPSDFSGLPYPDGTQARYLPPDWALELAREAQEAEGAILFLDEITTAPFSVQVALFRLVLERTIGQFTLPQNVRVIAAANPPDEVVGAWELPAPLANRFAHLDFQPLGPQDWIQGLIQGFQAPEIPVIRDWTRAYPQAVGLITGFLQSRPELLHQFPQDPSKRSKAWPSRRSWAAAARMLSAALTVSQDEGAIASVVGSCVGMPVGLELAALVGGDVLLDPREALEKPDKVQLPDRHDKLIVLLSGVAAVLAQAASELKGREDKPKIAKLWDATWTLVDRVAQERAVDVAAVGSMRLYRLWDSFMSQGLILSFPEEKTKLIRELRKSIES